MIEVLSAGLYTTVQDLGRYGYRNQGVPLSGVMDRPSAIHANSLVGNTKDMAVLEMTMQGPELKFNCSTQIAITGAKFDICLNNEFIHFNEPVNIKKGAVLKIVRAINGMRCYLAVSGGFDTELLLGSRSFYKGITTKEKLEKGDMLPIGKVTNLAKTSTKRIVTDHSNHNVKVFAGPEFELLNENQRNTLLKAGVTVSPQSNRMAYILNQEIDFGLPEIQTVPVQPGTVQLTPSGKLVVLMRDAQVTGGYPRIFQFNESSIDVLAQKRGGDLVRFNLIKTQ